ncbi:MAG: hypothetical protein CMK32_11315 [Porticoccaceae bacterium]|nr:hypothetical protein [Porticoccaceae bacterium]
MNKELMMERLVENGFDFLRKAVDDLNDYPKFSIIHFHAAVELFLKARLMDEHWSLVISQRQEPDWEKFISGNFQSVSLDGAAERLEKVARSGLTKQELQSFREVTKHRNKAVHFFHEAHSEEENRGKLLSIVKQQLTAWYFLHQLLIRRWEGIFAKWSESIAEIDKKLRSLHPYLQITYEQIQPEIEKRKLKGENFCSCPSCGFESQQDESDKKVVYEAKCLVCSLTEKKLKLECPECSHEVVFTNEGFGRCENCGKNFEPEELAGELIDSGAAHIAFQDGDDSWDLGNCSDCDGYHTVVRTDDESYVCTSCFLSLEHLKWCGWCNEPNTGDMEHSSWAGCSHCDGRAGWEKDD